MKIYEIRCTDDTILRINYTTEDITEVVKSHTYSYLQAREIYKELGQVMGLESTLKGVKELEK